MVGMQMKIQSRRRVNDGVWRSACVIAIALCAMQVMAKGTYFEPPPPPGKGIVLDEAGKPVAGAQVLMWGSTVYGSYLPFAGGDIKCEHEHYQLSASDGSFDIPSKIEAMPKGLAVSDFYVFAAKDGRYSYPGEYFAGNNVRINTHEVGKYYPSRDQPLKAKMGLAQPDKPLTAQDYWNMARIGCTCNPLAKEFDAIAKRMVNEDMKEARKKNPVVGSPGYWSNCGAWYWEVPN